MRPETVTFLLSDGSERDSGLCERNLNLLAHAQCIELDIGSECGGHGRCGADRLLIREEDRSKLSLVTEVERRHLGDQAIQDGWRLGCQAFPDKSGLSICASVRTSHKD